MEQRTCSVSTCPNKVDCRGWCRGHYRRWQRAGDVQAAVPLVPHVARAAACSMADCGDPVLARTWCMRHYRLWQVYGSPEDRPRYVRPASGIYPPGSKVPHEWANCRQCGEPALMRIGGKGFCSQACHGRGQMGDAHPLWTGDDASYAAQHARVHAARGTASECSRCGRSDDGVRYDWANLTGDYNDIWDFAPMCRPCHGAYDAPMKPRGSQLPIAKLTEAAVAEARRRYAAGESVLAMSREYGVSDVALRNAINRRTWKHVA